MAAVDETLVIFGGCSLNRNCTNAVYILQDRALPAYAEEEADVNFLRAREG